MYYYMICKEVTYTDIAELTHRLRTHSRRLIHEFSLATATDTGICNHEQCSEAARPAADRTSDLQSGQIKSLILEAAQSLLR
jgi:hypothetical protein